MNVRTSASSAGEIAIGGEMRVHRLGFGAMRLCGPGVWGPPADRANALSVLRRAIELGVNFIDTADAYGPDVSEELIAEALHPYPADLLIATKGGSTRSGPSQWARDCRPEHLRRALEGSLRRLRVERIDLYQLHGVDPNVPWSDQVGTLAEMRRAGKVRHVGLSNVTLPQLEEAQAIVPVASVQNRYNLGERASEPVLRYCEQRGLAFIPWFPLDAGDIHELAPLQGIANAHRASVYQIAIAWLLQHSPAMLPIPGTQSLQHLEENVAAASIHLSADEYDALEAAA